MFVFLQFGDNSAKNEKRSKDVVKDVNMDIRRYTATKVYSYGITVEEQGRDAWSCDAKNCDAWCYFPKSHVWYEIAELQAMVYYRFPRNSMGRSIVEVELQKLVKKRFVGHGISVDIDPYLTPGVFRIMIIPRGQGADMSAIAGALAELGVKDAKKARDLWRLKALCVLNRAVSVEHQKALPLIWRHLGDTRATPRRALDKTPGSHLSDNVCRYWLRGHCKFGDNCRFPHW